LSIKVLQVIRPSAGGMKQHLLTLLPRLDRGKFELEVACPPEQGLVAELTRLSIPVHIIPIADRLKPVADFVATARLVRLILKRRYQIVHTHGAKAGLVGRVAARLCQVPVIIATVHNSVYYEDRSRTQHKVLAFAHYMLGRGTDLLVVVSDALRFEAIYKEGIEPEKVKVIRNGIDLQRFRGNQPLDRKELGLPEGSPVIGTVARFASQKGVSYLLEAAAIIKQNIPDVMVLIVGDGPLRFELEQLAARLELAENCVFTGFREDVHRLIPLIDVFVIPSVSEGASICAMEALACGRPVVATDVGGLPEVIRHEQTGILVPPGDADAIAQAVQRLLLEPGECAALGARGSEMVLGQYDACTMVADISRAYEEVLAGKGVYYRPAGVAVD